MVCWQFEFVNQPFHIKQNKFPIGDFPCSSNINYQGYKKLPDSLWAMKPISVDQLNGNFLMPPQENVYTHNHIIFCAFLWYKTHKRNILTVIGDT